MVTGIPNVGKSTLLNNLVRKKITKTGDVPGITKSLQWIRIDKRIEILDTPAGQILKSLVDQGVTLGISSRGVGSTRSEGDYQVVQDDFQLICWDFVSEPSTPGAFMMKEAKEIKSFLLLDQIETRQWNR